MPIEKKISQKMEKNDNIMILKIICLVFGFIHSISTFLVKVVFYDILSEH